MSREGTTIGTVTVVLVIIAILISAGTLFYTMGLTTGISDLSSRVEELAAAERDLAAELKKVGTVVGESVSAIEDIEKRIAGVEEATKRITEEERKKEEQRKTLIVGYAADPVVLDTVESTHMHDFDVMVNIIETLVRPKAPDFAEIEQLLATSWEASPDSMVWTFHLRQGVKFHDGTNFNAQAVKYNFDRVIAAKKYEVESIEKVEVLDDYTVRFTLKEPFAPFLAILTFPRLSIVSPTAYETMGEEIMRHPVGTGPFIFDHWDEGIEVVLRANKDYWGGPPKLDKIVFKIIPEASTRRMELEAGYIDIDYAYDARLTDMPEFMKNPDLEVQGIPGQCSRYIGMNHAKEPFSNKLVRQAIAYAIDYDSIVEEILMGFGERLYCAVLPNFFASAQDDRNLIRYTYNPAKAKELLTKEYPNGFTATLIYPSLDPVRTDVAIQVQSNLADIGITVNLEGQDWGTITESLTGYDYDFIVYGWCADYQDPDTFTWPKMHSSAIPRPNYEHFSNTTFDALIEEARATPDLAKRKELYWQIQELANEEVVQVYMYYNIIMGAQRKWVESFYLTPFYWNYYYTAHKTYPI